MSRVSEGEKEIRLLLPGGREKPNGYGSGRTGRPGFFQTGFGLFHYHFLADAVGYYDVGA